MQNRQRCSRFSVVNSAYAELPRPVRWALNGIGALCLAAPPPGSDAPENALNPKVMTVVATTELLHAWLSADVNKVVLVRPDRYVAGTFEPRDEATFADQYASTLGARPSLCPDAQVAEGPVAATVGVQGCATPLAASYSGNALPFLTVSEEATSRLNTGRSAEQNFIRLGIRHIDHQIIAGFLLGLEYGRRTVISNKRASAER